METCPICQALRDLSESEDSIVLVEIEGIKIAALKDHQECCDGETLGKAVEMLRSDLSNGMLVDYEAVGHWAICVKPSELASQTKAQMRAG